MNDKNTNSRLGRGLAALIGDVPPVEATRITSGDGIRRLPVEFIVASPNNPRRHFAPEDLEDLTNSIREKGVMQPILVRPSPLDPDLYELVAGERRWRASQRAGLHEVPVIIREVDDREALELAIIENVQRADLNSLEESKGYDQLMQQFGYTQADLAQVIGKSRSHVANTLRLMKLPPSVQQYVSDGALSAGHARALITASNPEELAKRIIDGGLSVREAENLAQKQAQANENGEKAAQSSKSIKDADTLALEKTLSDLLGLKVAIDHKERGGKIEIKYRTLEQLDDVCQRLQSR
ncbi:ParB/RepB/Spo0J family partition protein [Maritalea porphyrae]|uniref:ParB/RepB/Spo0J family partition protein n=1 Tax=Maritalea porphyrae TaxID=880732 RepID=UPI0022AFF122|nr:ParB/RepB/Spo0J family partition protein [Maritalea porphyrae]MCZ4272263.1 ParB/RepB/Spo0J family partition protein [Maritalea porphyrae]